MGWFATRRTPRISREDMLASKPTRNEAVEWDRDENGDICITMVRSKASWKLELLAKILYLPDRRRVVLDEVGSGVWEMCDGATTVAMMIRRLSERYKLNRKEAEISLLHYLRQLGKKKLVGFLVERGQP